MAYVIAPKSSNYSQITNMEMMLLYAFSHEIPINRALVIMYHTVIHDEMVGGLPYARLLTKIFKYYGVDLTGEPHPVMNDKYAIDVPIINLKMGIRYDKKKRTISYVSDETVTPP